MVAVTQCLRGGVSLSTYAVGVALERNGVLSGGDMTTEAVVTKLAYLFGLTNNTQVRHISLSSDQVHFFVQNDSGALRTKRIAGRERAVLQCWVKLGTKCCQFDILGGYVNGLGVGCVHVVGCALFCLLWVVERDTQVPHGQATGYAYDRKASTSACAHRYPRMHGVSCFTTSSAVGRPAQR